MRNIEPRLASRRRQSLAMRAQGQSHCLFHVCSRRCARARAPRAWYAAHGVLATCPAWQIAADRQSESSAVAGRQKCLATCMNGATMRATCVGAIPMQMAVTAMCAVCAQQVLPSAHRGVLGPPTSMTRRRWTPPLRSCSCRHLCHPVTRLLKACTRDRETAREPRMRTRHLVSHVSRRFRCRHLEHTKLTCLAGGNRASVNQVMALEASACAAQAVIQDAEQCIGGVRLGQEMADTQAGARLMPILHQSACRDDLY